MNIKTKQTDGLVDAAASEIVTWGPRYATGIELIDQQHQELVELINQLYQACLSGNEKARIVFKDAMSRMVDYVKFHFDAEQKLLEKINYPQYPEHKKLHETLIKSILAAAGEYKSGKKFVPNHFVRTLKDWVFGHIAIQDKKYAAYAAEQIRKGLIKEDDIGLV